MASGTINQDYGARLWNEMTTTLSDFNAVPASNFRPIIGVWGSNTANKPGGSYYGFYIHFQSSANYQIQVAVNITYEDKMYIRKCNNGTWGTWKTFTAS